MSDEMTPREHGDMRDLLMAGTQRIRPAMSRRARISAGIAVALIVATVGGVATAVLNVERQAVAPAGRAPAHTSPAPPPASEAPSVQVPGERRVLQVPGGGQVTRLPAVFAPAPGTYVTLRPDPVLTVRLLLGSGVWMDENGIDSGSAQGFESVEDVHPWTARLADGSGMCLLIKSDLGGGGWSEVACDEPGLPASIQREVDGTMLRFTIVDDAVRVVALP